MSRPWVVIAAGLLWIVAAVIAAATSAAAGFDPGAIVLAIVPLVMPTVGVLIVWQRPRNLIGWLFCGLGVAWALTGISINADIETASSTPELWLVWLVSWAWIVALMGTFTFPFLLFPNGRLLSPRWRIVAWIAAAAITVSVLRAGFTQPTVSDSGLRNPAYIPVLADVFSIGDAFLGIVSTLALVVLAFAPVTSLVLRLRRSRGIERQQIKWFAYLAFAWVAGTIAIGLTAEAVAALTGAGTGWAGGLIWGILPFAVIVGLPAAVGVAILRHRLYDIDTLIRRTLVYGLLTLSLGALYVLLALLPVAVVGSGSAPDIVIAGATLAVAALARPVRGRIQRLVDRRFFRHRYDAVCTAEAFAVSMRDEIGLATLSDELLGVVRETMQPAHASLWLRASADRRS